MLRERANPVNDADAAILEALTTENSEALGALRGQVDSALLDYLDGLFEVSEDIPRWEGLVRALRLEGLVASTLRACEALAPMGKDFDRQSQVYGALAAYERHLGMNGSAAIHQRVANRLAFVPNLDARMPELEEGELYVQAAINDPDAYAARVDGLGDYPLLHDPSRDPVMTKAGFIGLPGLAGVRAVDDCSFFVMDGEGRPILQVEADMFGCRHVGCREAGIVLTPLVPDHPQLGAAKTLAVRQMRLVVEWCGAPCAYFDQREGEPFVAALTIWLNETRANLIPVTAAWIDLSLDAGEIERRYRDAHRQSLRWGRKNITIESTTRPEPRLMEAYNAIYAADDRVAPMSSENLSYWMERGRFTLYIASYESNPVVALLSSRHGKTTYYWASIKLRVGNKPLGHVVLHQAIMDAKAEGQTRFDFGYLQEAICFNEKLRNIALYKRGFATHTEQYYRHQGEFIP